MGGRGGLLRVFFVCLLPVCIAFKHDVVLPSKSRIVGFDEGAWRRIGLEIAASSMVTQCVYLKVEALAVPLGF